MASSNAKTEIRHDETREEREARIKARRDEAIKHVWMTPGQAKTLKRAQRGL